MIPKAVKRESAESSDATPVIFAITWACACPISGVRNVVVLAERMCCSMSRRSDVSAPSRRRPF
jgi:hypothetical protein